MTPMKAHMSFMDRPPRSRRSVATHVPGENSALHFFVPRHLDRLELRFVRRLRVVVEALEGHDALTQIGESDRERIHAGKFLGKCNADVFGVGPLHRATSSFFRSDLPS